MSLSRYYPRDIASIQDEFERMFRSFLGGTGSSESAPTTAGAWSPALDVEETEDAFVLHVELPGCRPEDVEVSLEENVLTVTGERRFYDERDAEGFRRIERRFGRFHRAVRLPDRVDPAQVEADFDHGLLTITVPKAEQAKPRRIEVRSGARSEGSSGESGVLPKAPGGTEGGTGTGMQGGTATGEQLS
ncbi:MAG: Hsp20/alpha crystallin family protein [Actinomycetota bacterium]|nr:Hsp20/alpha crystallin family protein [Actinomycetota bacterium]